MDHMDPMAPTDPADPTDRNGATDSPSHAAAGDDASSDTAEEGFPPAGFERWRRETALGTVGTGIARGLQNVFAPPANQPVIVAPVPGDPPDPDRLKVILDPDDPTKSIVLMPPVERSEPGEPAEPGAADDDVDSAG